jgi:hypothetical protein
MATFIKPHINYYDRAMYLLRFMAQLATDLVHKMGTSEKPFSTYLRSVFGIVVVYCTCSTFILSSSFRILSASDSAFAFDALALPIFSRNASFFSAASLAVGLWSLPG